MGIRVPEDWLRANYAGDLDAVLAAQALPAKPRVIPPGLPAVIAVEASEGRWMARIANWRPASDNVRAKSIKAWYAVKSKDKQVVRDFVGRLGCDCPRASRRRRVTLRVEKRRRPLPDPTNLLKSWLDAMVDGEFLRDDSTEWCRPEVPEVVIVDGLAYPVVSTITVEDL